MGDTYPSIRVAAAQAAPVLLDRERTVDKACAIIREAGANGAQLVAFPEGFIPVHPLWFHFQPAGSLEAIALSAELVKNAVVVPSDATDALCKAALDADAYVVMGINEKEPDSMGTLYNSLLFISRHGEVLGIRRKLVPTLAERVVHTAGSGDSIRTFPTDYGPISGLMCGENSNPLATYAMQAMGARIHVGSWPNFFPRMQDIADIAGRAIAYQNSCFVVNVCGAISDEMKERLPVTDADRAYLEKASGLGGSTVYAPGGTVVAGPLPAGEGILYADCDLDAIIPRKIVHDYAGDYNRFDIFQLLVNTEPALPSIRVREGRSGGAPRLAAADRVDTLAAEWRQLEPGPEPGAESGGSDKMAADT